jgi:chromate transporter
MRVQSSIGEQGANRISLIALWWIFFRIACTSFGGFMAMVSVMQNVVVERRKFLSDHDVLDGLSLASVLPGPLAVNAVAYVGYRLRGPAGAAVCVCAAVLPACALMILASFAYFRWGHMPAVSRVFMGVVPAVTAIIAAAAWRMCRTSVTGFHEGALAAGAALAMLCFKEIYVTLAVLLFAGIAGRFWFGQTAGKHLVAQSSDLPVETGEPDALSKAAVSRANANLLAFAMPASLAAPLMSFEPVLLLKLLSVFAGMSLLMFGGGYVFIPLLQQAVVENYGWVTQQEFIDAVALGQVTPGPILISATFIGFKVAGLAGAIVATIGMFGPSAVLTVLCARVLNRVKGSMNVQAVLRGVRAATAGMVFTAAILIGKSAAPGWISAALFISALIVLVRYRIEAVWIVPTSGLIGFFMY